MKTSLALAAALAIVVAPSLTPPAGRSSRRPPGPTSTRSRPCEPRTVSCTSPGIRTATCSTRGSRPTARSAPTSPIQSGWASTSDPALTAVPGGLRAIWGGIRTTDTTETNQDLNTAFSADGGATWALQPGSIVPIGAQAYASRHERDDAPQRDDARDLVRHGRHVGARGPDPDTPNFNYQAAGYGNDSNLASDASGAAMLAWFSDNPPGRPRAGASAPTARPRARRMTMPGTQVMVGGPELSRTPIVARPNSGGFYIARSVGYPTANRVRVWRVGAPSTALLDKTETSAETAISTDAKGRLWVGVDGRHVRRRARARRRARTRTRALRRAGRRRRGQGRALDLHARRQRDRLGRRRRAGGLRHRRRAPTPRPT